MKIFISSGLNSAYNYAQQKIQENQQIAAVVAIAGIAIGLAALYTYYQKPQPTNSTLSPPEAQPQHSEQQALTTQPQTNEQPLPAIQPQPTQQQPLVIQPQMDDQQPQHSEQQAPHSETLLPPQHRLFKPFSSTTAFKKTFQKPTQSPLCFPALPPTPETPPIINRKSTKSFLINPQFIKTDLQFASNLGESVQLPLYIPNPYFNEQDSYQTVMTIAPKTADLLRKEIRKSKHIPRQTIGINSNTPPKILKIALKNRWNAKLVLADQNNNRYPFFISPDMAGILSKHATFKSVRIQPNKAPPSLPTKEENEASKRRFAETDRQIDELFKQTETRKIGFTDSDDA